MFSALIFIFVLSVLVVVHEWGHFIMARLHGIRVERFSIGFGPVLLKTKRGDTEYCFSLLPLGGYVKMAGEDSKEATGASWEYDSKAIWQKAMVVAAGPLMNAFLAFVLFSAVFMIGEPKLTTKVGRVLEHSPAYKAGILKDDEILSINGIKVTYWEDAVKEIRKSEGPIQINIRRAGNEQAIQLLPEKNEATELNSGKKTKVSFIGVSPAMQMTHIRHGFFEALGLGAEKVASLTTMIFKSFGLMFSGAVPFKESMAGPIGIFVMTGEAAKLGISYLLYFMGSLSVSLFILNALPVPVLDGGHLLFLLIEKIKGSPLRESIREKMTQGGMALLLLLMVFVIAQDMNRFSIFQNIKDKIFPNKNTEVRL